MTQRPLEFRAWDNEEQKFIYAEPVYGFFPSIGGNSLDTNQYENPQQFTGLYDKHGKKIFEGDVVKMLHGGWASKSESDERTLEEYLDSLTKTYEVVFIQGGFVGKRNTGAYDPWHTDNEGNTYTRLIADKHGFIEVIGNVYQNKELLQTNNE